MLLLLLPPLEEGAARQTETAVDDDCLPPSSLSVRFRFRRFSSGVIFAQCEQNRATLSSTKMTQVLLRRGIEPSAKLRNDYLRHFVSQQALPQSQIHGRRQIRKLMENPLPSPIAIEIYFCCLTFNQKSHQWPLLTTYSPSRRRRCCLGLHLCRRTPLCSGNSLKRTDDRRCHLRRPPSPRPARTGKQGRRRQRVPPADQINLADEGERERDGFPIIITAAPARSLMEIFLLLLPARHTDPAALLSILARRKIPQSLLRARTRRQLRQRFENRG